MTRKFLLNPFEEADRQVLEQGHWVVATVYPQMSWPEKRQIVEFEGKDFVLLPQSPGADQNAAIAFRTDGYALSVEEARCEVNAFVVLSHGLREVDCQFWLGVGVICPGQ
jgi:hypothetical protein